eukprot:419568_1
MAFPEAVLQKHLNTLNDKDYADDNKLKSISTLSKEEQSVCESIKRQLCIVLGISTEFLKVSDIGKYVAMYVQSLIDDDPNITTSKVKRLHQKYSEGAVLLLFASVAQFQRRVCVNNFFSLVVPKDCILNKETGITYVPKATMKMMNIKYPKTSESKYKFPVISLIYNNFPQSEVLVSYHSHIFDVSDLEKFFQSKKWTASILRKQYAHHLKLFNSNQSHRIAHIMKQSLNILSKSMRDVVEQILPPNFIMYITNNKQKWLIRSILSKLNKQCNVHNHEWSKWSSYIDKALAITGVETEGQTLHLFYSKFPFIIEAISRIQSIVGLDQFHDIYWKTMKQTVGHQKYLDLMNLISKIEGRNCSYEYCTKQENRKDGLIEKYKTCSACRNVFYCSRSCQKRDWARKHKENCRGKL